jgi:hypothetical protein
MSYQFLKKKKCPKIPLVLKGLRQFRWLGDGPGIIKYHLQIICRGQRVKRALFSWNTFMWSWGQLLAKSPSKFARCLTWCQNVCCFLGQLLFSWSTECGHMNALWRCIMAMHYGDPVLSLLCIGTHIWIIFVSEYWINPLRMEVYFGHHNKIKMMKILEVYQNPSTLVLIVKLLRQAFNSNGTIGILIETICPRGKCFIVGIFLKMPPVIKS